MQITEAMKTRLVVEARKYVEVCMLLSEPADFAMVANAFFRGAIIVQEMQAEALRTELANK